MRCTLFASLSMLVLAATAHANLLDDGDFEAATTQTQTSNSDWVMTFNTPDTVEPSGEFRFENWSSYPPGAPPGMGVWFKAFEGNQNAGVDPLADMDVTQSLSAPSDGDYLLTFWAKRETNFNANQWLVSLDNGGTPESVDLMASAPTDGSWNQFSVTLLGVTSGDTLTVAAAMVGGSDALANPQSGFVDTFDLTVIPEPSSVVLACFGVAGLLSRRRVR